MSVSSHLTLSMLISFKFYDSWQLLREIEEYVPKISKFGVLSGREIFLDFSTHAPVFFVVTQISTPNVLGSNLRRTVSIQTKAQFYPKPDCHMNK